MIQGGLGLEKSDFALTNRHLVINESVVCADLDNEAVLLNVETGVYFGVGTTGKQIWTLLEQGVAQDELRRQLLATFDVLPEQLEVDLAAFLTALQSYGLIRLPDDT
jgi:hypothetical protein